MPKTKNFQPTFICLTILILMSIVALATAPVSNQWSIVRAASTNNEAARDFFNFPWRQGKGFANYPLLSSALVMTTFTVTNTNDSGAGSLRQAIEDANANPGADVITFNISAGGMQAIRPASALPFLFDLVVIDGSSQPGFSGTPLIELSGENAGAGIDGLTIRADGSILRNLKITRFETGISVSASNCSVEGCHLMANNSSGAKVGGANNVIGGLTAAQRNVIAGNSLSGLGIDSNQTVIGNFIGTDSSGNTAVPNSGTGININGSNNVIGGTVAGARNIIAGSTSDSGIRIGNGANNNRLEGNYIGLNAGGTAALPNAYGVVILSGNNTIGGTVAGAGNVISGNLFFGLLLGNQATGTIIKGNIIGASPAGTTAIGNGTGISIQGAVNNSIGDGTANGRNLIAHNGSTGNSAGGGIFINGTPASTGNNIFGNSIHSNNGKGIRLGNSDAIFPLPNDAGDPDTGDHNLQNYPILNPITTPGTVTGTIDSAALNSAYPIRIDFFANTRSDMLNAAIPLNGEGEEYLASISVNTPGAFSFNYSPVVGKPIITATATDANGNTSEFSNGTCVPLTFTPTTLPDATVNSFYSQQLTVIGGTAPYMFNFINGLPAGMYVTTTGELSGAPTVTGTFNFTVSASDVNGCTGQQAYTLFIPACASISLLPTTPLPFGVVGTPYSSTSIGVAGSGSYSFSQTGLPPGMSLIGTVPASRTLTGTPNVPGVYSLVVTATAANGCPGTRTFPIVVHSATPTIIVTTTADENGTNPSACSLREALTAANTNVAFGGCNAGQVGYDTIGFSLPAAPTYTISYANALPIITEPIYLNGRTADVIFPRVELTGRGIAVRSGYSYLSSLVVNGALIGITLSGGTGRYVVENCYVGTNATGTGAGPATTIGVGIYDGAALSRIGGTAAGQANVISGNSVGVEVISDFAFSNSIVGNFIGTNASGTAGIPNSIGIRLYDKAYFNTIFSNTIAYNSSDGVLIFNGSFPDSPPRRNRVSGNRIFRNGGLGINLQGGSNLPCSPANVSVTCNDEGDIDDGPNGLQNAPVLTGFTTSTRTVTGTLNSTPNTSFSLRYYANAAVDPSGYGEGEIEVFGANVTTNASGNATFSHVIPTPAAPAVDPLIGRPYITALAIGNAASNSGDTSEFSNAVSSNLPPTITLRSPLVQQGNPASNQLLASIGDADQAANTLTITINGSNAGATVNGATISNPAIAANGSVTANIIAVCGATNASFSLAVTDNAGATANATLNVAVLPALSPDITTQPISQSVFIGQSAMFTVSASNATGYQWRKNGINIAGANASSYTIGSATLAAAGNYDVVVSGACNSVSSSVAVLNITNRLPVALCQNVTVTADATCTAMADVNNGSSDPDGDALTITQSPTGPYAVGTHTVTLRADDGRGGVSSCTATVTVNAPKPVPRITNPTIGTIAAVGTPVNLTGTFTDTPGTTHTAMWQIMSDFPTLTLPGIVTDPIGTTPGTVSATHTFAAAGIYEIKLTVTNNCGETSFINTIGTEQFSAVIVIYDPTAGFATGNGWINSPAGAFTSNPFLTGKANFGFVSKYVNGASLPTGETDFKFKAGDLNFTSTSYEWLVIAGAKAQFKGNGMINGQGNFRFMLTVIDGQQSGGGGTDKFRIRIWNENGGGLMYDNQLNAPDSADPTTIIGAGQITIRKK